MARAMKDCGIEWIGEIPETWNRIRFKYLHNGLNTGEAIDKQLWSADESDTVFYTAGLTPIKTKYSDFPEWKYTRENDILLARNGTPYVYFPAVGACYTDHIIRAAMKDNINKRFVQYGLQQSIGAVVVDSVSIATWSASLWNEQVLPWPSAIEQKKIVDFLNKKCAEVDSVIAQTEKTIEEYKTLKQSIITEAVTKGVRGKRLMKDSGIAWIGGIPEKWQCTKAKYRIIISNGSDPTTTGDIPVYGSGAASFKTCGDYKEGPTVLIGRKGATLHIPHYIEGKYWNVDTAFDVKVKEGFSLRYYYYLAIVFDYKFYISQTTLPGMTQTNYENMFLPVPTITEQQEIVDFLDAKCTEIDQLIESKQQLLEQLAIYKKSIIYEYVTGKKEVPACQ